MAQASALGTMILVAHSLPVEGAVARATGVAWGPTLGLRLGGALALGALLNLAYRAGDFLQQPARLLWQPAARADTLAAWALEQGQMLVMVFFIIAALMALLRLLRTLGISVGAGLLIREARSGQLLRRDIFLTMRFLGLCHSLIEDTLLIVLIGADLSAILWARLAFAVLVTAALARLLRSERASPDIAAKTP